MKNALLLLGLMLTASMHAKPTEEQKAGLLALRDYIIEKECEKNPDKKGCREFMIYRKQSQ